MLVGLPQVKRVFMRVSLYYQEALVYTSQQIVRLKTLVIRVGMEHGTWAI